MSGQGPDQSAELGTGGRNLVRGLVFASHPFPAFMNGVAGGAFYWIAAGWQGGGIVRIALSILFVHAAIGSMNDYLDIDLDRRTKPDKPLVRGDITPQTALAFSLLAVLVGLGLSLTFGWAPALMAMIVLAAGMLYDFFAKGSLWSWVPYAVSIPALPVWSFLAAGVFSPIGLASFPLGALMSLALNIANTLPDLAGDTEYGIRGLAHRLGRQRSLAVTWGCFAITLILLALSPVVFGNATGVLFTGVGVGAVVLIVMIADELRGSEASLKRGWYLSAILAGILGIAWVASLPRA